MEMPAMIERVWPVLALWAAFWVIMGLGSWLS
jgi:hypothetical protein